jgi:predicted nucleic acid-binding protein
LNHFVLDSSVALAWCFEDETSPAGDRILDLLESAEAIVPVVWPTEVGNALLAGERRRRITAAGVSRSLALLRSLNIRLDDSDPRLQVDDWVTLARRHSLSVYDAAYLAVAIREGVPLATFDRALARAAGQAGVRLLQP